MAGRRSPRLGANPFSKLRPLPTSVKQGPARRTLSVAREIGETVANAAAFESQSVVGLTESLLREGLARMASARGEDFEYPQRPIKRR